MLLADYQCLNYYKDNQLYLAGNQNFFDEYRMRFGGCAAIAATNIFLYLAYKNHIAIEDIKFPLDEIKMSQISKRIYHLIKPVHFYQCEDADHLKKLNILGKQFTLPPTLGVFNTVHFRLGISRVFKHFNLSYQSDTLRSSKLSDWHEYIEYHLQNNHPIVLLNTLNSVNMKFKLPESQKDRDIPLNKHWVVIYVKQDDYIDVLTWGGTARLSLSELWNADEQTWGFNCHFIAYWLK